MLTNTTNTRTDGLAVVSRSLDGSLMKLVEMCQGSTYKDSPVQASPKLIHAGKTAAATMSGLCKTSNTFRENVISNDVGIIASMGKVGGEEGGDSTRAFINLCFLRCLFSLTLHTSSTLHAPTVLIRNFCVELILSHVPTPPLDDGGMVRADLCLRSISKLVEETSAEVWGRLVVNENANKFLELLTSFVSMDWNPPTTTFDRTRECQEMSLSLLVEITSQAKSNEFENEKRILAGIAFEGGALDACIKVVGREAMSRVKKRREREGGGGEEEEEEEEEGEDEKEEKEGGGGVAAKVGARGYMTKVERGCERVILNILEAERAGIGTIFPPAFMRACKLGWLRRAPSMLVHSAEEGRKHSGLSQRIALCMISWAMELSGGGKVEWGEKEDAVEGGGEQFRSSSADNLSRKNSMTMRGRRTSRSNPAAKRMSMEERFKSDTARVLKSKASTVSFITMSGCLNPITQLLCHFDQKIVAYAVKVFETMMETFGGGKKKKAGRMKKEAGEDKGGEDDGESLHVALIEQACVPPLFIMSRVGSRKYSPSFFVCEKVLKSLIAKVSDVQSNKEKVLTSFGRMMLSKLSVSGSSALRANIGCALILLTAGNVKARREMCQGGQGGEVGEGVDMGVGGDGRGVKEEEVGLIDVVLSMVQLGGRAGNIGPKAFLSAVQCLCSVDERPIVDYKGDGRTGREAEEEEEWKGAQFYGDFDLREMRRDGEAGSVEYESYGEVGVVWVVTEDNEGGVKMEVPSVWEISFIAPKLASYLKGQIVPGDVEKVTMEATSYDAAEEFFSHIVCGWASLSKARNRYNLDFCLNLLALAETYECDILMKAYARCIYEKIDRGNAFRILEVGLEARENWLCVVTFYRIVEDLEGCLAGSVGGGVRDQVRILERFLLKLFG